MDPAARATGHGTTRDGRGDAAVAARRSITIGRPVDELSRLWHEPGTIGRVLGDRAPDDAEVRFRPAPNDLGTEVTLSLRLDPPSGPAHALAPIAGGAAGTLLATKALHRFKSLAETGEIPTLTRQPAARHGGRDR